MGVEFAEVATIIPAIYIVLGVALFFVGIYARRRARLKTDEGTAVQLGFSSFALSMGLVTFVLTTYSLLTRSPFFLAEFGFLTFHFALFSFVASIVLFYAYLRVLGQPRHPPPHP